MRPPAVGRRIAGVDLGGTRLKAGVCDEAGRLHSFLIRPTPADRSPDELIAAVGDLVANALSAAGGAGEGAEGVLVAACGLVDRDRGLFLSSSVLPGWRDVPLAAHLSRWIGLPVRLDNDATAAIFGEWWQGAARGARHLVGMTLGTGIGGGVILDGAVYRGATGNAGEFGHLTVDPEGEPCFCGNRGCLGQVASASGLVRRYERELRAGRPTLLGARGRGSTLTALAVHEAAEAGDELAREVVAAVGRALGIGAAGLLSAFNPEVVVFTGGLTGMGDRLLAPIRREAAARTYPHLSAAARITFGELGEHAGVIGAAGLWLHSPPT